MYEGSAMLLAKISCEAAESHEVAVKPSVEGFANGAGERGEVDTHAFLWVKQLKLVRVR